METHSHQSFPCNRRERRELRHRNGPERGGDVDVQQQLQSINEDLSNLIDLINNRTQEYQGQADRGRDVLRSGWDALRNSYRGHQNQTRRGLRDVFRRYRYPQPGRTARDMVDNVPRLPMRELASMRPQDRIEFGRRRELHMRELEKYANATDQWGPLPEVGKTDGVNSYMYVRHGSDAQGRPVLYAWVPYHAGWRNRQSPASRLQRLDPDTGQWHLANGVPPGMDVSNLDAIYSNVMHRVNTDPAMRHMQDQNTDLETYWLRPGIANHSLYDRPVSYRDYRDMMRFHARQGGLTDHNRNMRHRFRLLRRLNNPGRGASAPQPERRPQWQVEHAPGRTTYRYEAEEGAPGGGFRQGFLPDGTFYQEFD